jgi:receptor-type tyrosine-protein phosphatase Q
VAIGSTSIRLTWSAPLAEEQNGVITSYRITITEVESGGRVLETTAAATDTLLIINDLDPHFTYRCSIAAMTIAIGPVISAQVTTFQEGSC